MEVYLLLALALASTTGASLTLRQDDSDIGNRVAEMQERNDYLEAKVKSAMANYEEMAHNYFIFNQRFEQTRAELNMKIGEYNIKYDTCSWLNEETKNIVTQTNNEVIGLNEKLAALMQG